MAQRYHLRRVKKVGLLVFLCLGILALLLWRPQFGSTDDSRTYWEFLAAGALGALVAIAELVSRYRDDPAAALISLPAVIYVGVNAAAAVGALYLIHAFNWSFGAVGGTLGLTQVLVAGFGSAAVFRSSLFNVTAGDQVVGIGPSAVLNVILAAADRAVDRQRAAIRAETAAEIMKDFSFADADSLLRYSVATMQNISSDEATVIENQIARLRDAANAQVSDSVKSYILGLCLLTITGRKVLERAVQQINPPAPPGTPAPAPAAPAPAAPAAAPAAPAAPATARARGTRTRGTRTRGTRTGGGIRPASSPNSNV